MTNQRREAIAKMAKIKAGKRQVRNVNKTTPAWVRWTMRKVEANAPGDQEGLEGWIP